MYVYRVNGAISFIAGGFTEVVGCSLLVTLFIVKAGHPDLLIRNTKHSSQAKELRACIELDTKKLFTID